jgi:hypothetical protein
MAPRKPFPETYSHAHPIPDLVQNHRRFYSVDCDIDNTPCQNGAAVSGNLSDVPESFIRAKTNSCTLPCQAVRCVARFIRRGQ